MLKRYKAVCFSLLFALTTRAQQVPQAINYQAVARTSKGLIIPAQAVKVRFSILDATVTGAVVYQETHTTNTNDYGLFTLQIGKGSVISGSFSTINWGSADKFLKVEISPKGDNTFQLQATTQLVSVPFAFYAEKTRLIGGNAINITNGNTINGNYQAGLGIGISGPVISHNMKAGAGVRINADSIVGNYQAGLGIGITGSVISHNLKAGRGIRINADSILANYEAGNAIAINGNTISANYQAGVGIGISGAVISHNLKAGPGIRINADSIMASYQAGNAIAINGNTISGNYQAGVGIGISGAVISHNLKAGPGIRINADSIVGNYQAGNAIAINGNTIAANYLAGNAITINGRTISANYQAGTGININGSTISHNLVAGNGININGNVISAPGSTNYWLPDSNGIYYPPPENVGIRTRPSSNISLTVLGETTNNIGSNPALFTSNDDWHTAVGFRNYNTQYTFIVGGPKNQELQQNNFGIYNNTIARWPLTISGKDDYVSIGDPERFPTPARSALHVKKGDVNIDEIGSGIIVRSKSGQCWRITVDDQGVVVANKIACP